MDIIKGRELLRKGITIYDMPLKVAYYARVSTDSKDQLNSLENQTNYFNEMIKENKNWIFKGSYIDEGITGTSVKNRKEFLRMIEDASLGNIDLILTKEISRFSRNTLDSIKYTEYLLRHGTIVYFLTDNINTINEDSEFRLTIMSSLAQDEVRKLSSRIKFGINRMIKDRKLIGSNLTGYYKKNGKYVINEKEAFIIRHIFNTYISGCTSLKEISNNLSKMGYLNKKGKPYSQTTISKFITNPRYKGYYTARLTEVIDYKTHKKVKVPKENQIIEKDNNIPAIIDEKLWNRVNNLYNKRKKSIHKHILNSNKYSKYSCLIYCSKCNQIYIRSSGSTRKNSPTYSCKNYKSNGKNICNSPIIKEEYLDKIFIDIFNEIIDINLITSSLINEYTNIINNYNKSNEIKSIDSEKDKLLDLLINNIISKEEYLNKKNKLDSKLNNKSYINIDNLNNIKNILNLEDELPNLIKIFIKRIEIFPLTNRSHIRLKIYFNYDKYIIKEIKFNNRKNELIVLV